MRQPEQSDHAEAYRVQAGHPGPGACGRSNPPVFTVVPGANYYLADLGVRPIAGAERGWPPGRAADCIAGRPCLVHGGFAVNPAIYVCSGARLGKGPEHEVSPGLRRQNPGRSGASPSAFIDKTEPRSGGRHQVTQVPVDSADQPGPATSSQSEAVMPADANGHPPASEANDDRIPAAANGHRAGAESTAVSDRTTPAQPQPLAEPPSLPERTGPAERLMSFIIRKLAWSRLSDPKVAVTVSGVGLLLGMIVGATAPNSETLRFVELPLSHIFPSILPHHVLAAAILYSGDILACLGLAGMLWAYSQGWKPDPRRLFLVSSAIVAIMVSLTPVGSSDTASYAAYGRLASLGQNPYHANSLAWLRIHDYAYLHVVGQQWTHQPSVYGPVATAVQSFAAWIGGPSVEVTIWVLMILNGLAFLGVGYLLLK